MPSVFLFLSCFVMICFVLFCFVLFFFEMPWGCCQGDPNAAPASQGEVYST